MRLDPFPVTGVVITDLQSSNGLAEQEGEGSQVGMTLGQFLDTFIVLRSVLEVHHVTEVVLGLFFVLVDVGEEVLGELQGDGEEDEELIQDFGVAVPRKRLDFFDVLFEEIWVLNGEVLVELWSLKLTREIVCCEMPSGHTRNVIGGNVVTETSLLVDANKHILVRCRMVSN